MWNEYLFPLINNQTRQIEIQKLACSITIQWLVEKTSVPQVDLEAQLLFVTLIVGFCRFYLKTVCDELCWNGVDVRGLLRSQCVVVVVVSKEPATAAACQ